MPGKQKHIWPLLKEPLGWYPEIERLNWTIEEDLHEKVPVFPPVPRRPQLPNPKDPSPALPKPEPAPDANGRRPTLRELQSYGKGRALNVLAPLPWDDHEYPSEVPVPKKARDDYQLIYKASAHLHKLLSRKKLPPGEDEDRKRLPPPNRQLPPGRVPPDRQLPAVVSKAGMVNGNQLIEAESIKDKLRTMLGPTPLELLDEYLKAAGIRYFSAHELCKHNWYKTKARGKQIPSKTRDIHGRRIAVWDAMFRFFDPDHILVRALPNYVVPSPELWPNILPALRVLDRFRHWLNQPVAGISGYRLPWYNTAIEGSETSYHMNFAAVDFTFVNRNEQGDIDASVFYKFISSIYNERGSGVGAYRGFVHYDRAMARHENRRKAERWIHRARRNHRDVFGGKSFVYVGKG